MNKAITKLQFKTSVLENGNTLCFYPENSEVTILPNGDYFCSVNHRLCFERPSHSYVLKIMKPTGRNITIEKFYN